MNTDAPSNELLEYAELDPDTIINALEAIGLQPDGRILELNSYENRVYRLGIEDAAPVITKFYRPSRWTDKQILEEHQFCDALASEDLPVVAPQKVGGETLLKFNQFRFSLYPLQGGRAPEFDNLDNLYTMGQCLSRIHVVGAATPFADRPNINIDSFGRESAEFLLQRFIPDSLREVYESLARDLLDVVDMRLKEFERIRQIRTHGDCHSGNVLWRDDAPHFVDFDDARMAPAVQDIWMLLSGSKQEQEIQLSSVLEGYEEFGRFDPIELNIVESLRTLRLMHYAAWLASRWTDPAFPRAFPWFNTERYWGEHILELREQYAAMQEPPMRIL